MIVGVVLAAGAGSRFGGAKAVARFRGERLVDRAVANLAACDRVLVVAGAHDLGEVPGASTVVNTAWRSGMGSSLRAALHAAAEPEALVVVLVDQPLIGPESVRRVIAAYRDGALIATATYDGRRGHPVLFGSSVFEELARTLTGDAGARDFLAARASTVVCVDCTGTGRPDDVDTVAELRRLSQADGGS